MVPIHTLRFTLEDGEFVHAQLRCPYGPMDPRATCAMWQDQESGRSPKRIPGCGGQDALDHASPGDVIHGTVELWHGPVVAEVVWNGEGWIILTGDALPASVPEEAPDA